LFVYFLSKKAHAHDRTRAEINNDQIKLGFCYVSSSLSRLSHLKMTGQVAFSDQLLSRKSVDKTIQLAFCGFIKKIKRKF
jgi:hypothetical protein